MIVRGVGPIPCDYLLCGTTPGRDEDRAGQPFVGKTGQELNRHLDGDRLPARSQIFLTNRIRQFGGKDYVYTSADYARDEPPLIDEMVRVSPSIIIPMGREAIRWFMGDVDVDDVHGLPWYLPTDKLVALRLHGYHPRSAQPIVFPLYHIAAGFRNPETSALVSYDFEQLRAFFAGQLTTRKLYDDPYSQPTYQEITEPAMVAVDALRPIAIDTEGSPRAPWSIQYSQHAGTAYVIRAGATAALQRFGELLIKHRPRIVYHNSLHDIPMMRALGLPDDLPFDDTMVAAYLLQVEPKGLKPLCIRHCNMAMQSYEDVMGDASHRLALDYFQCLWDIEQADYEVEQGAEFERINRTPLRDAAGQPKRDKTGAIKYRKTRVLPAIPRSPLHKAVERALRSRTPRKLWENWEDDQPHIRIEAVRRLGDMPEPTLDHVPSVSAIHYGGRDADGTARLFPEMESRVSALGLQCVYQLELGTYPLIDRMHAVGIKPDLAHFKEFSRDLAFEIADLQVQLEQETTIEGFNANSGDQVADFVFERLGLDGYKKTSSGRFSTNDKVLEALEKEHPEFPVISTIRSYREIYKLKHTFVDRIPDFVHRWPYDGRVHATFRTTRVVTGRLAASDPNLLAQPKHGKFAKRFRKGWVAEDGHLLGEWDLSQIELRVLAHLSQDPVMLAIFRGERRNPDGSLIDLHAALAQRIFGVAPKDQDKSKHRLPAKAVNFGLPMGMTCKGLTVELRKNGVEIDEDDAQRWIDETMALYAGVPRYQQACIAEAKRNGYIRCLSGRIRYIGGIKSWDEMIRAEAERFSFSTKIQEGAQWIMKQNETAIWQDIIISNRGRVQPLLQVHDAINLEFDDDPSLAKELNSQMMTIMTRAPKGFSVPIDSSGEYGYNMADMQEFK